MEFPSRLKKGLLGGWHVLFGECSFVFFGELDSSLIFIVSFCHEGSAAPYWAMSFRSGDRTV